MKISEVKFLISILFYIDITFQESVKIIRALEGKNWTNGVDSFHIPRSVCYQESSGCRNYCNTSYTTEETETRCFCSCTCSKKYSTVTYFKNNWRCLKNEEVRTQLGCEKNATLFSGERKRNRLRTLKTSKARKTKLKHFSGQCIINSNSSWYIGCHGVRIPLGHQKATTEMFLLQWRSKRKSYFIKVNKSIDPIFRGKVINLGITCKSLTTITEGCLLFKLVGSFTCPVSVTPVSTPSLGGKQRNDEVSSFSQPGIIAGVAVSAALVLLLAVVVFICRRRVPRKHTRSSTSDQIKDTCTAPRNAMMNSELELEENDGFDTTMYASRYEVPQQQVLQGPMCNQKTISSEGNSHSDGAYAVVNIQEGHHFCGHGNVQEPVYNVLEDPEVMFQNYGPGIGQPLYYASAVLSVKDSVESVDNGPTDPEPVHNVTEDPEFQNYVSGIDQPMYYVLEDLLESVDNGPTEP